VGSAATLPAYLLQKENIMGRPRLDLIGKVFGRLTVVEFGGINKRKNCDWVCKCSCGNTIKTRGNRLVNGSTKSCGCLRLEVVRHGEHHKLAQKEGTAFRAVLYQYKANAKARGLVWELSDEQFKILTSAKCYYTGNPPSRIQRSKSGSKDMYVYNGVDRLDNTEGYTIKNCVPCCFEVNSMKRDFSKEKFIALCIKVAERAMSNVVTNN
jgi:hypothetical protein